MSVLRKLSGSQNCFYSKINLSFKFISCKLFEVSLYIFEQNFLKFQILLYLTLAYFSLSLVFGKLPTNPLGFLDPFKTEDNIVFLLSKN